MTISTTCKTIPWGKRIFVPEEVAEPFYNSPGWVALADGQKWARKNNGRLESAHGTLETRIEEAKIIPDLSGPAWRMWVTTNSEEDVGVDIEGKFGRRRKLVCAVIHGGGIILNSPESLQAAYTHRTPKGEPSINQENISRLLAGFLPNGQQVRTYTLDQVMKEDLAELPPIYAIVEPLRDVAGTASGRVRFDKLPRNKLFIMRAGHPTTAENYAKILEKTGVREYGNWHSLTNADPTNPSGRVLHVGIYGHGLDANYYLLNDACFVGVRRSEGAEGAAPRQT